MNGIGKLLSEAMMETLGDERRCGDELIQGRAGKDYLDGGDGNDFVSGDGGADMLFGGVVNESKSLLWEYGGLSRKQMNNKTEGVRYGDEM